MSRIIFAVVLVAIIVSAVARLVMRRRGRVEVLDGEGRRRFNPGRVDFRALAPYAALAGVLLLMIASVRAVPVGHALVIFNTVTRGFRLARQGITFVPPLIAETQDYDLRRLEYTMSGMQGEGRKAAVDDSLWSP